MSKPKKKKNISCITRDSEEFSAIISALKRTFSRSPTVRDFLRQHRREEIWVKKDGIQAKKPKVFYKCFHCQKEFNSTQVQVDHINAVIPVNIPARHMSINAIIDRLFCDTSNLQILCKEHHKEKSQYENSLRKEWLIKQKYIIYETTNRINNKKYIGIHKCEDYDDDYLGSGIALRKALVKYGKENFYRCILFVFDNIEEAINKEIELVNDDIVNSEDYYNIALGGNFYNNEDTIGTIADKLKKSIICHETGEIFPSVNDAANAVRNWPSSVSRVIDDPNGTVNNLHFFSCDTYNADISVKYPNIGRSIICLNSRKKYGSIKDAADDLGLNYKSLRNAFTFRTSDNVFHIDGYYFLHEDEYDINLKYIINIKKIRCIEMNKTFATCTEAGGFLGKENPSFAGIAIGKAIRTGSKIYGFHWENIIEELIL